MTHFSVAVIKTPEQKRIDDLMARYDENLRVDPYVDITREDALAKAREETAEAKAMIAAGETSSEWTVKLASHVDDTDEALLDWYAEYWCEVERDEEGNFLSTYNPDSKWDYYMPVEEMTFDEWTKSGDDAEEVLRGEWKKLSVDGDGFWKPEYYLETYGDEETFVKSCMLPAAWAVVTPDGEWHEPGKMGWFACHDATAKSRRDWAEHFEERFITPYKDTGATVVMLDCHI